MSIANIKQTGLRRLTLVVLIVPITLYSLVLYLGASLWDFTVDLTSGVSSAWNGRR